MPIKSNLKSLAPRRQTYKQEITLLSHGYTNPTAWPDGRITIYPWDNSIEQWLLENVRKIGKQELVYGLLRLCCDLNGGAIDDFIVEEINVVLLVSRALSIDGKVTYTSSCPFCGHKKQETIEVPAELEKVGEKQSNYPGFDVISLPVVQDTVKIRPLLVRDEKMVINRTEDIKKQVPDAELRTLMRVITINDSAPDTLEELVTWYRALHPKDANYLEDQGRKITPHLNTVIPHACDDPECGKRFTHPLSFDQEFFR